MDIYDACTWVGEYLDEISRANFADIAGGVVDCGGILAAVGISYSYLIVAVGGGSVAAAGCAADYRAIERPNVRSISRSSLQSRAALGYGYGWLGVYRQIQRNCAVATCHIRKILRISAARRISCTV